MTDLSLPCDTEPEQHGPSCNPAVFDEHLATKCPECGNGTKCSPALCGRRQRIVVLRKLLQESADLLTKKPTAELYVLAQERVLRRKG